MRNLLSLIIVCLLLSSCMTIFEGTKATITVGCDVPDPVTAITSTDTLTFTNQPMTLQLKRNHLDQPIRFESEHWALQSLVPGRRSNPYSLLSLCFTGVGILVDIVSGAAYKPVQNYYHVDAARKDTLSAPLPLLDYQKSLSNVEKPSFMAPLPSRPFFCHELRLSVNFGNVFNNASYDRFGKLARENQHLTEDPDAFSCGLGSVMNASISLSYFYHLNPQWSAGLIVGTGRRPYDDLVIEKTTTPQGNDASEPLYAGNLNCTDWYFMPAAKLKWYFMHKSCIYSKVAFGAMSQHEYFKAVNCDLFNDSRRTWHVAYQLSPIGIEVGSGSLRFFTELGYGMEGVVNIGTSYHF